jgi:hypothetical protein
MGKQRNDDVVLSIKSNVLDKSIIPWDQRNWTLIQRNQPEPPKPGQQLANHRIVNETRIEGNVLEFMELLGYSPSHQFMTKGYRYEYGLISIDLQKVYKTDNELTLLEPLLEEPIWMVHAYQKCSQDQVKQVSFQLFQIAQHLASLMNLGVVDHSLLQSRIKYN